MDQKNLGHRVFSLIVHTVDKLFGENSLQRINDSWSENVETQLDQRCIELIDFHRVGRTSSGNVFPLKLLCWISSWPKDSRAWKLDLRSFNSAWNVRKLCNSPWISQFPRSFHAYCGTATLDVRNFRFDSRFMRTQFAPLYSQKSSIFYTGSQIVSFIGYPWALPSTKKSEEMEFTWQFVSPTKNYNECLTFTVIYIHRNLKESIRLPPTSQELKVTLISC